MVQFQDSYEGLPDRVVLKLYDRRFSNQFRNDERIPPWSLEHQYRQFILDGDAETIFDIFYDCKCTMEDVRKSTARCEAYLHWRLEGMLECKVDAYQQLSQYQGKQIPRFYYRVRLLEGSALEPSNEYADIQGILLEYLEGFP